MKQEKRMIFNGGFVLMLTMSIFTTNVFASNREGANNTSTSQLNKADKIQSLMEAKSFVFKAEFEQPASGEAQPLYNYHDLKVTANETTANLPYDGTAYTSSPMLDEAVVMFTSNDFNYSVNEEEQGWNIEIGTSDTRSSVTMNLHVDKTGEAILRVNDDRRQPISYSGYIQENDDEEEEALIQEEVIGNELSIEDQVSFFGEASPNTEIEI